MVDFTDPGDTQGLEDGEEWLLGRSLLTGSAKCECEHYIGSEPFRIRALRAVVEVVVAGPEVLCEHASFKCRRLCVC